MSYEQYRKAKIESGQLFQDFVVDAAHNILGLVIQQYASRTYQMTVGESLNGVEIKNDEKYASTGNLWIETGEKARPREGDYFPSGIYRDDNTWLYIIGDYNTLFVFQKEFLKNLHRSGRYRDLENRTKTSIGFLLRDRDARKYAGVIMTPNASKKIVKIAGDMKKIGEELHQIAKENKNQLSLFPLEYPEDK